MTKVTLKSQLAGSRTCGSCSLCCKLLPLHRGEAQDTRTAAELIKHRLLSLKEAVTTIKTFDKPAGGMCKYQRHGKGCTIYDRRPLASQR